MSQDELLYLTLASFLVAHLCQIQLTYGNPLRYDPFGRLMPKKNQGKSL
jgi:hypothetical protein